jgi:hypothetical protein
MYLGRLSFNGLISENIQRPTLITGVKVEMAGPAACWTQFGKIREKKKKREMNLA